MAISKSSSWRSVIYMLAQLSVVEHRQKISQLPAKEASKLFDQQIIWDLEDPSGHWADHSTISQGSHTAASFVMKRLSVGVTGTAINTPESGAICKNGGVVRMFTATIVFDLLTEQLRWFHPICSDVHTDKLNLLHMIWPRTALHVLVFVQLAQGTSLSELRCCEVCTPWLSCHNWAKMGSQQAARMECACAHRACVWVCVCVCVCVRTHHVIGCLHQSKRLTITCVRTIQYTVL